MIKKLTTSILFVFFLVSMSGCSSFESVGKNISSQSGGLPRTVTFYSLDGHVIKKWSGNIFIETGLNRNFLSFLLNRKRIIISGDYTIEEN